MTGAQSRRNPATVRLTLTSAQVEKAKSIFSVLRGVDHHLLLFVGEGTDGDAAKARAEVYLKSYGMTTHVQVIGAEQSALRDKYGVTSEAAFFVRPDGHIAWRGPADLTDLTDYLNQFYVRRNKAGHRNAGVRGADTQPSLQRIA